VNRRRQDADSKARLLHAGERLFAEHGVDRVRLREINAHAGQRNASALHYHFGSRDGLVEAILSAHETAMDEQVRPRLDALEAAPAPPTVRAIVEVWVDALTDQLRTQSGRDFLRIVPQVLHYVKRTVRHGADLTAARQPARTFALLDRCMANIPTAVRRERLVAYSLILATLFADRAELVESGARLTLDDDQFATHAVDVICGAISAPSTVAPRSRPSGRRRTTAVDGPGNAANLSGNQTD
jgi:AcrR family transcriptional regulator